MVDKDLGRSLTNTVLVTIMVVTGQILTSILGGYAFARIDFKGRDTLFLLYLGSVMVPFVVLIIPLFQLMLQVGWLDNLAALIIPFTFTAYGTFLMRQFFVAIPKEIEEAALLDNASRSTILWKIMVPLARPAIATLATFGFLYAWNSFFWPLVIINSGNPDGRVLSLALSTLGGRAQHRHQPRVRRSRHRDDTADPRLLVRPALLRRELRLQRSQVKDPSHVSSELQLRHQAVQG